MSAPVFTPQLIGQAENTLRAVLADFLSGTDLTYHTWVLLHATSMQGGTADRAALTGVAVNALKIDEQAVDAKIATLVEAGLMTATAEVVRVTAKGSDLYQRLRGTMAPVQGRMLSDLPTEDLAAAARVLTTITDRANEYLAGRS